MYRSFVDTEAGEVAQVDFGYVGKLLDPDQHVMRKAWVFVMILGYSRHMFCKVVFDQKTATWLQLHIGASSSSEELSELLFRTISKRR